MTYDEPEGWDLCGIHYKATADVANRITIEVGGSQAYRTYMTLDQLLDCIVVRDPGDLQVEQIRDISERCTIAYLEAQKDVLRAVQKHLAESV
jgi:hypothetical protein